jgi:hypothetical protein
VEWGGGCFGGVLFLVLGYLDREGAPWYYDLAVLVLGIFVPLLFLVGLAGTYVKFRGQVGWISLIGFLLCFAGAEWAAINAFMYAPNLYRHLGERTWDHGSAPEECGLCLLSKLSQLLNFPQTWLFVGLSIVGLATVRKKGVLKDWGLLVLAMALFGWVYQLTDDVAGIVDVRSVHVVFGILFSLSWMALGYALLSSKNKVGLRRRARDPQLHPAGSLRGAFDHLERREPD